jgi:hypothetical protein
VRKSGTNKDEKKRTEKRKFLIPVYEYMYVLRGHLQSSSNRK